MLLHPDRWNPTTYVRKNGVVVHDSETPDGSAAALVAELEKPGDRDDGHGGKYGSGYHAVTDGLGGYTVLADADAGPFAAPPTNNTWWHVCMPGYAAQSGGDWSDELSAAHIRGVAAFVVDRWNADGRSWPPVYRDASELALGGGGYTGHKQVSDAWHDSDHWDPGPGFPWDVLAAEIAALVAPPITPSIPTAPIPNLAKDEAMPRIYDVGTDGGIWCLDAGVLRHLSPEQLEAFRRANAGADGVLHYLELAISDDDFAQLKTIYTVAG